MSKTQVVYQTETYNYTPKKIADEFARSYFGDVRQVGKWDGMKFKLIDGNATYQVKTVVDKGIECYQIVRLS